METVRHQCLRFAKSHGLSISGNAKTAIAVGNGHWATAFNDWNELFAFFVAARNAPTRPWSES